MPNRLIRPGINDSEAVNSLSESAEVFYRRLLLIVDDYGRFVGNPALLRCSLFALQLDRWPVQKVLDSLTECGNAIITTGDYRGQPLVTVYEFQGQKYVQVNNFGQRIQSKSSKYPPPSGAQNDPRFAMQNPTVVNGGPRCPTVKHGDPQLPLESIPPCSTVTHGDSPFHGRARTETETETETETDAKAQETRTNGNGRWKHDEAFMEFVVDYLATGGAFVDEDFREAFEFCWKTLDFDQKLARRGGLTKHAEEYHADPRFVPKPLKFLRTEWERPVKPPPRPAAVKESVTTQAKRVLAEREKARKERERAPKT
jgi:hypothetical protein